MAIILTDRRSIVNEAETVTGWTGAGYGITTTDVAEAGAAVAASLAETTGEVYYGLTANNVSNNLIYVWLFNNALQPTWTTAPNALLLGDGTNQIGFQQAGSDRKIFAHSDGPVNWQCAVIDGSIANTLSTANAISGSLASLDLTAITQIGGDFETQSKALGGGYNVAVDILRIGIDGIRIQGGNTTDYGVFTEIAVADRSTANQAGHGVFRETSPISFGIQSPITFGDTANGTQNTVFQDSGVTIVYEDRDIADDKYYFAVEGNASVTNSFELTGSTIAAAGPHVLIRANTNNIDTLTFDGITFSALGNSITFSDFADAGGGDHTIENCTFDGCGRIRPGNTTFQDNIITNTTDTVNGALYIDANSATNTWQNLDFIMGAGGDHAIYITAAGTYDFTNFTFTGYGANATGNSAVYNNSGGAVTINQSGGAAPTVNNGASATTTIVSSATITITNIVTESEVRLINSDNFREVYAGNESVNGFLQSATVVTGGTGYDNADILTVTGGTGTAATLNITTDGSGVIVSAGVQSNGEYSVDPTNPVSHTGGSGSSATFNLNIKGEFEYTYGGTPTADIIIFHIDYKDLRFSNFSLPSSNSGLFVSQIVDRVYYNP